MNGQEVNFCTASGEPLDKSEQYKQDLTQNACVFIRVDEKNAIELFKQIMSRAILIKEVIDVFATYTQPELDYTQLSFEESVQ